MALTLAHADWSKDPRKRWAAWGRSTDEGFFVDAVRPVDDPLELLTVRYAGFDFPLGVPREYARRLGVDRFVDLLVDAGRGPLSDFYVLAERPADIALGRPFYPRRPGGTKRAHLWAGLGLSGPGALYRTCDRATPNQPAGCPLFWTLGANQVGRAAISGWRDLLAPARRARGADLALWPFDGDLAELLARAPTVVAEVYPGLGYGALGLNQGRWSKRRQPDRVARGATLCDFSTRAGVRLAPAVEQSIRAGFPPDAGGEDAFDATVGLLTMMASLRGELPAHPFTEPPAWWPIEGWVLGKAWSPND